VLFDGLVLLLLFQFADYPMEKPMIVISALNPIDLGRILIMLQMDVAAMLGYTGAVFKQFFGSAAGIAFASAVLLLWIAVPLYWSLKMFKSKDL
jgi:Cu-processing system permease protein